MMKNIGSWWIVSMRSPGSTHRIKDICAEIEYESSPSSPGKEQRKNIAGRAYSLCKGPEAGRSVVNSIK